MAARLMGYVSASNTPTIVNPVGFYGVATGGIGSPIAVTINSVNYQYLQFNATGTLTVTKAGFFEFCAVGGGTGSCAPSVPGGGGGAGQIIFGIVELSANQTVTIGAGGNKVADGAQSQGGNTSIAATAPFVTLALGGSSIVIAGNGGPFVGGGHGGHGEGSGGGGASGQSNGFRGGSSLNASNNAGGGGGSTAVGGNGTNASGGVGGTGGAGFDVSAFIGGSELRKAMGGGGGGTTTGGAAATGGVAGSATTTPPNGNANSGGGGGGGLASSTTGNGGSGIMYVRFEV